MGAQGFGKDLTSILKLLQKHKTLAGELVAHRSLLQVREFLGFPVDLLCFILVLLFMKLPKSENKKEPLHCCLE